MFWLLCDQRHIYVCRREILKKKKKEDLPSSTSDPSKRFFICVWAPGWEWRGRAALTEVRYLLALLWSFTKPSNVSPGICCLQKASCSIVVNDPDWEQVRRQCDAHVRLQNPWPYPVTFRSIVEKCCYPKFTTFSEKLLCCSCLKLFSLSSVKAESWCEQKSLWFEQHFCEALETNSWVQGNTHTPHCLRLPKQRISCCPMFPSGLPGWMTLTQCCRFVSGATKTRLKAEIKFQITTSKFCSRSLSFVWIFIWYFVALR